MIQWGTCGYGVSFPTMRLFRRHNARKHDGKAEAVHVGRFGGPLHGDVLKRPQR